MGLFRRSKRADRPATPSAGGSSNSGLFSRVFGRKPTQASHTARETARKRRSVRLDNGHGSTGNAAALMHDAKRNSTFTPSPPPAHSPPPPSPNVTRSFSVKHKGSTTSSNNVRLGGGLLGFVRKKSNMSLRQSMQPTPSPGTASSRANSGWIAPTGPPTASPLFDKLSSRPMTAYEPGSTPVAASFLGPTPAGDKRASMTHTPPARASLLRAASTKAKAPPSAYAAVDDVPPPLPPKPVTSRAATTAIPSQETEDPVPDSPVDDDLSLHVRATSPPPRPASALETLEMAAPLGPVLGVRPGASLARGRSISGPGRSVNSAVTTVTTTEDSETVISPTPAPVESPGTPTTLGLETPILGGMSNLSPPRPTIEPPQVSPSELDIPAAEMVIPSPVGLKVEYMPGTPRSAPQSPETKAASGLSAAGIANASAVGAVAAAVFATEDDKSESEEAETVDYKPTALAPALTLPYEKEPLSPIDLNSGSLGAMSISDKFATPGDAADEDTSARKPLTIVPQRPSSPRSDTSSPAFQTPLTSIPADIPTPIIRTSTPQPTGAETSETEEIVTSEPATDGNTLVPPVAATVPLADIPRTPESATRPAERSTAISTPTVPLESFMAAKEADEVSDNDTAPADVKAESGSAKSPLEHPAPILPDIVGPTYDLARGDTPPLSPHDEPIVSSEFKAATALPAVPPVPPKDTPTSLNGIVRVEHKPDSQTTLAPPTDSPNGLHKSLSVRSPTKTPATTPQRADTLTPRRAASSSSLGGSPRTPSSFKGSPRSPATPGSPGTPGSAASDATLDDFMGLFKTVITRDRGMSIRDAARRAEHRPVV